MDYRRSAGNLIFLLAGAAALVLNLPALYLATETGSYGEEVQAWLRFVVIACVVAAPFDFIALGSRRKENDEAREEAPKSTVRGIMLFTILLSGAGSLLLLIGQAVGELAALMSILFLTGLLSLFQYPVFLAAARTHIAPDSLVLNLAAGGTYECPVRKAAVGVEGFTGGFCGLLRFRKLVLPASDFSHHAPVFAQRKARYWLDEAGRGYRMGSLFLSASALMAIALIVLLLPGTGFGSAMELATFSLWTSVICAGSAQVLAGSYERIVALGFLQRRRGQQWRPMQFAEDEPAISLEQKGEDAGPPRTFMTSWPAAYRIAHYLSWSVLNLAARLHPLVAGHPALWVLPPDNRTRHLPSWVTREFPLESKRSP